jgi:hypothetical protein
MIITIILRTLWRSYHAIFFCSTKRYKKITKIYDIILFNKKRTCVFNEDLCKPTFYYNFQSLYLSGTKIIISIFGGYKNSTKIWHNLFCQIAYLCFSRRPVSQLYFAYRSVIIVVQNIFLWYKKVGLQK